jgi:acyl-CoA thioesterase
MMTVRAPSSTITWNIEFMHPRAPLDVEDLLYYECAAIQAGRGYAHTEGRIYHPNGQLLALSRQMVGVYDKVSL